MSEPVTADSVFDIFTYSLSMDNELDHTFSSLTIKSVELLDEGIYSCSAENAYGEISIPAGQLIVQGTHLTQCSPLPPYTLMNKLPFSQCIFL